MSQEKGVHINFKSLTNNFINLIGCYIFIGFFINGFLTNNITYNFYTIICEIITVMLNTIIYIYNFFFLYNRTLCNTEYNYYHRYTLFAIKIMSTILSISVMILVFKFIPFKNENCNSYSYRLCFFGRWEAFFGIISFICLFLWIIIFSSCVTCFCCITNKKNKYTSYYNGSYTYSSVIC